MFGCAVRGNAFDDNFVLESSDSISLNRIFFDSFAGCCSLDKFRLHPVSSQTYSIECSIKLFVEFCQLTFIVTVNVCRRGIFTGSGSVLIRLMACIDRKWRGWISCVNDGI